MKEGVGLYFLRGFIQPFLYIFDIFLANTKENIRIPTLSLNVLLGYTWIALTPDP